MKMDNEFFERVGLLIEQARSHIGRTADLTMCITNYEIGRMIVEKEQGGKSRAAYGKGLLKELSEYLNNRFEKGFSESTLRNMRKFYLAYAPSIQQAMPAELEDGVERSITDMIAANGISQKSQAMLAEFSPFKLSWSHYLILMRIKNAQERQFYEIEAYNQQWDYRRLQREYNSSLYERLALSRDKDAVMRLSAEGHIVRKPQDMLKNPLVLEFAGLDEKSEYSLYLPDKALLQRKLNSECKTVKYTH